MKTLESLTVSSYNEKTRLQVRENIHAWLPFSSHIFTLWPVFAGEGRYVAGHWCKHDSFEKFDIQIVIEGNLKVWFNNKWHLLEAGDAGLIPHGPHRLATGPAGFCRKRCIGIQGVVSKILTRQFEMDSFGLVRNFSSPAFDALYERLHLLLGMHDFSTVSELSSLAYQIMMYVVSRRNAGELPPELILCNQFIEQNIAKSISVADLCRAAGCGRTALNQLYRKHYNESPIARMIKLRLEYAAQLLTAGALRIKEVALLCGYKSQLYFSSDFHKYFGMSPRDYRKHTPLLSFHEKRK